MTEKPGIKSYILLYSAFFLFSLTSIASKFSARYELLSIPFILCYGVMLFLLGVYALMWQQVLKRFPLSTAYSNKPVETLFSMTWGVILFKEQVTVNMVIGCIIILAGIRLVVTDSE